MNRTIQRNWDRRNRNFIKKQKRQERLQEAGEILTGLACFIATIIVVYIFIDVVGATAWIASGQAIPFDDFFLGKLTLSIIKAIVL